MAETKATKDVPTNGSSDLKKRKIDQLEPPSISTPRDSPTPRSLTPTSEAQMEAIRKLDICFVDDPEDAEYEWIRLPKKRAYNLKPVALEDRTGEPDTANVPLTATRLSDKRKVTMWAKLDTGAGANLINHSTLNKLLGEKTSKYLRAPTLGVADFELLGHKDIKVTHCVYLDFSAGRSKKAFEHVRFHVIEDESYDASDDGVPDIVLGYEFLIEQKMVMIDVSAPLLLGACFC